MKKTHNSDTTCQAPGSIVEDGYTQFSTRYDSETGTIWCWMEPAPRPCINTTLKDELLLLHRQLVTTYKNPRSDTVWPFRHFILASRIPGIYNLGGDLSLFRQYIVNRKEKALRDYAHKCIELLHNNINNLELPITTVSLVQGQGLGGGFEMALSCDVIIAERSSQMGFPEIIFNLFPGMGAYNLLTRRVGSALAERIILSGNTYSGSELFDMGIVDVLAEDGEGVEATEDYLKSQNQSHNTIRSIKKIRQIVHPITRQSLLDIVDIWVEAAMDLNEKDLAKMGRLLYLQKIAKDSKALKAQSSNTVMRRADWRKINNVSFPLKTHLGETVIHDRRKRDRRSEE
ncbi:crotonase/enoyl-CoA hydratase family protein [Desulfopila inferna]|uniref:crotonase/enoyl-CoA hydratase family protein n=1 Tax=Desulfopila inferna TaxID=468528 RepID=UPI00196422AF|nr:crotonase/enoyl-CoA hydratase family protein [Desulfopila inferna]MBM9606563.1 crotonase/enoyl-CoA hydratase family protein [Desulfopila inferna]